MATSGAELKVLRTLLEKPEAEIYGLDLLRTTGLKSGTLYPLLDRLELRGWLASRWEQVDPAEMGRPRRRFYRLTGFGHAEAAALLQDYGIVADRVTWNLT